MILLSNPIWKRWYVWLIVGVFLVAVFSGGGEDIPSEVPLDDSQEMVNESESKDEETVLSLEDVENIKNRMEEEFEEEKEFTGEEYKLYSIEYDVKNNQLNLTVDYQIDPLPSAEELISTNEAWTWGIAEAMLGISEKDFDIRTTAVTKVGEDEFLYWGSTRYLYITGEYTWREGSAFELLKGV